MIEDVRLADELHIFDISVISGVRPCGKTIDFTRCGRRNNGFLFVYDGEVTFLDEQRKTIVISNGELLVLTSGLIFPASTFYVTPLK